MQKGVILLDCGSRERGKGGQVGADRDNGQVSGPMYQLLEKRRTWTKNEMVEIKSGRWGVVPAKDKDKSRTVSMNGAIGGDS